MKWISDVEDEDSLSETSSSKVKIANVANDENPLADFPFDKLPTELLVKIFHHTRADSTLDARKTKYPYPVALAQVCHHWRNVALCAPTLWTDIRLVQHTEKTREAARIYLERSKTCPIFLTWFSDPEQTYADIQRVIDDLIIPGAERWQRITLFTGDYSAGHILLAAVKPLDFPILQDVEISCTMVESPPSNPTFCHNAPLLRRCRFRSVPFLPPLPSNLVVLDCMFRPLEPTEFDLDPLLEFLPHVAHSLEHLRFGPPPVSKVRITPRTSRIPLEHLKSLLIKDSHVILDHIFTPNLTHFTASRPHDAMDAAKIFEGFSAPMLRSIQFHDAPLLPILNAHNFPSTFPQLESITLSCCTDELAFVLLLKPPEPNKSSSQKASRHREVQNPFPNLKDLTISDMTVWTSLQAAIEKRIKNGNKLLRKIQLPKEEAMEAIISHLRRWLPTQGIELVLYKPGELSMSPPEFQDDFCDEEARLFLDIVERIEWEKYNEDDDFDRNWDFYDGYDEEDEEDDDLYYDDFYEG